MVKLFLPIENKKAFRRKSHEVDTTENRDGIC